LAPFAEQVTNVAREVGRGWPPRAVRPSVPGAAGTWKDLDRQRQPARGQSDHQVRAIAEVATAVTKGDLTRSIQVETAAKSRSSRTTSTR
jgi:hypothetical protein